MNKKVRRKLKPMFETRVHRAIYPLGDNAGEIELAIDRGKIDTGKGSMPLCELELELKRRDKEQYFKSRAPSRMQFRHSSRSRANRNVGMSSLTVSKSAR